MEERAINLRGKAAIVMPYVQMWEPEMVKEGPESVEEVNDAVKRAVDRMVRKQFQHRDLGWKHVGFYRMEGALEALFVDVESCSKTDDIGGAKKAMLMALNLESS